MSGEIQKKVKELANKLNERGQSLALAESCTGGLISSAITKEPGVSSFFKGSVVSYAAEVKSRVLGVPMDTIKEFGEVSIEVAQKMAEGARENLNADWSVAVTGIAGPSGGTADKPVGTVCFGICGPDFVETSKQLFTGLERTQIQEQTLSFALDMILKKFN